MAMPVPVAYTPAPFDLAFVVVEPAIHFVLVIDRKVIRKILLACRCPAAPDSAAF
jgi:hypothetical protein